MTAKGPGGINPISYGIIFIILFQRNIIIFPSFAFLSVAFQDFFHDFFPELSVIKRNSYK